MYYYIKKDDSQNVIMYVSDIHKITDSHYEEITEAEYNQYIAEMRANLPDPTPVEMPEDIIDELIDDEQSEAPIDELVDALIGEEVT